MRTKICIAATAMALGMSGSAFAGTPASAASCDGCHAANNPTNPHLCGQPEAYLVSATKAYKTGERKNAVMTALVAALDDAAIAEISAYYAAQPCK